MTAASCRCGAEWSGLKPEHCTGYGCHQTFASTSAGDFHRVGDHAVSTGPNRRRCLSVDEMLVRGMAQNTKGYWVRVPYDGRFDQQVGADYGLADYDWGPVPLKEFAGVLETVRQDYREALDRLAGQ